MRALTEALLLSLSCLLYRHLALDSFPSISGNDASCVHDNHLPRPCLTEKVTLRHPDMAVCSGYDVRRGQEGLVHCGYSVPYKLSSLSPPCCRSAWSCGGICRLLAITSWSQNIPARRNHHRLCQSPPTCRERARSSSASPCCTASTGTEKSKLGLVVGNLVACASYCCWVLTTAATASYHLDAAVKSCCF